MQLTNEGGEVSVLCGTHLREGNLASLILEQYIYIFRRELLQILTCVSRYRPLVLKHG